MGSGSSTETGDFQEKQPPAFAPAGQASLAGRLGSVIPPTHAHSLPNITNPSSPPFVGFCGAAAASKPDPWAVQSTCRPLALLVPVMGTDCKCIWRWAQNAGASTQWPGSSF